MTVFQSFSELNIDTRLLDSLNKSHFTKPTDIQAKAIPFALEGRDVVGCAQTGTGKTLAFLLPLLQKLLENNDQQALVMVPTRELAFQVIGVVRNLIGREQKALLSSILLIGGVDLKRQTKQLQARPQLIVATPGRLNDHLRRGTVVLNRCHCVVLDEADRMLDIGFEPQLRTIAKHLPNHRQTMMFSATFDKRVVDIAKVYLKNEVRVDAASAQHPLKSITQKVQRAQQEKKTDALVNALQTYAGSAIVFTRTKARADKVSRTLDKMGFSATALHSGRSQATRKRALEGFRNSKFRVLVATDIASRGLDVPDVALVVNFDLPEAVEDYVHRIGRTARAGANGVALSLLGPDDGRQWARIVRDCGAPAVKGMDPPPTQSIKTRNPFKRSKRYGSNAKKNGSKIKTS